MDFSSVTFTKSAVGGTFFALVGDRKFVKFPAVGTVPELIIEESSSVDDEPEDAWSRRFEMRDNARFAGTHLA